MADLQRIVADLANEQQKRIHQERMDTILKYQTHLYDKASAYTKLIIGLGYAGFFTAWASTRPYLSRREVLWSALCIVVSLVFFVAFEIFQMIVTATTFTTLRRIGAASAQQLDSVVKEEQARGARKAGWLMYVWWYGILPICVVPGLAGQEF